MTAVTTQGPWQVLALLSQGCGCISGSGVWPPPSQLDSWSLFPGPPKVPPNCHPCLQSGGVVRAPSPHVGSPLPYLFAGFVLGLIIHPVQLIQRLHEHRPYLVYELMDLGEPGLMPPASLLWSGHPTLRPSSTASPLYYSHPYPSVLLHSHQHAHLQLLHSHLYLLHRYMDCTCTHTHRLNQHQHSLLYDVFLFQGGPGVTGRGERGVPRH